MEEDINTNSGKISGNTTKENSAEGKISGNSGAGVTEAGKIGGNSVTESLSTDSEPSSILMQKQAPTTRKQRIAFATDEKGLKVLPLDFGDSDGDWRIIESEDLFEVLYLDQGKIISIDPAMVKNNYTLLETFWKEKRNLWESGSGQIRSTIEDKYGSKNLSDCFKKMKYAYEQLFTLEKINDYHARLTRQRLDSGESILDPLIRMMVKDGEADPTEIEGIIEEGIKHNLNTEEVATIIKKAIDSRQFRPYGTPFGKLLSEELLSVSWMTDANMIEKKKEDEEKQKRGREIFDNVYAYSVEDIGQIIFNNENAAKSYISKGLLKNSIDYFSSAKANQFITIIEGQKNEHLRYLQVTYRLNPKLPYRFKPTLDLKTIKELVDTFSETLENYQLGKEQFKKGFVEVWTYETNKDAYNKLKNIKESSTDTDTAFVSLLFSFNPNLQYRFAEKILIKDILELSTQINANKPNWEAGKKELYSGLITSWLQATGKSDIVKKWDAVKANFKSQDVGLEHFLHILNEKTEYAKLNADQTAIEYPKIQSGKIIQTTINLNIKNRGYIESNISMAKVLPGVSVSEKLLSFNASANETNKYFLLSIDSSKLLKGVEYKTAITISTTANQQIEIPITFKIGFPNNAFILEVLKYSGIVAAFFALVRLIIASGHPNWLNTDFNYFLSTDHAFAYQSNFSLFGWAFFLFIGLFILGMYFLIKYLYKDGK